MIHRLKRRLGWFSEQIFNDSFNAEQSKATFKFRLFKYLIHDLLPENIITSLCWGKEFNQ